MAPRPHTHHPGLPAAAPALGAALPPYLQDKPSVMSLALLALVHVQKVPEEARRAWCASAAATDTRIQVSLRALSDLPVNKGRTVARDAAPRTKALRR